MLPEIKRDAAGRLGNATRDALKDMIVARIEAAARAGEVAPKTWALCKELGIGEKTGDNLFAELKAEGRLSWRTIYTGTPHFQVRLITVRDSGLTTSAPKKPEPKPKKPIKTFLLKPQRLEAIGISDRQLYGTLAQSVKVLRHRGYVVFKEKGGVRVGNALLSFEELAAKAAREQRLMEAR